MEELHEELGELLGDLEEASKVPAKRRHLNIKPTVEKTTGLLYDRGALPDDLVRLVMLVTTPSHLDQTSRGALIRNLYPAAMVPSEAILRVLGCLGHGQLKAPLSVQALLLRWLVLVYHLLKDKDVLSQAYSVLFNLLDTAVTRPSLCQLLALVTRRKHIRHHRIQSILNLYRQTGSDPPLAGLLRVYKNYYPEIIVGEATKGKASSFKHPDLEWRRHLDEFQSDQLARSRADASRVSDGFKVNRSIGKAASAVPEVYTLHAQETSVTLEEIQTAESLVQNLERIELPSHVVAALADPLLQKLLLLRPDHDADTRINNWLMACISDVTSGDADWVLLLDFAETVRDYVAVTKMLSPTLLTFFAHFLGLWNGIEKRHVVLEALAYIPMLSWDELRKSVLQPLESAILDGTPDSQLGLLDYYTTLVRRWAILMRSARDMAQLSTASFSQLVSHVNKLALTVVQTSQHTSRDMAVLEFYECTSAITSDASLLTHVEIVIPPPLLVYQLHFSQSAATLSRLYGILAAYKRSWEIVTGRESKRQVTPNERHVTRTFNGFLMDICNCLWRMRAFVTSDPNAQGCCVPRSVVSALSEYLARIDPKMPLELSCGPSHSPVFCLHALAYTRLLEAAAGIPDDPDDERRLTRPVSQGALALSRATGGLGLTWQSYRVGLLDYLEVVGFVGVPKLMYATMKNLKRERPSS